MLLQNLITGLIILAASPQGDAVSFHEEYRSEWEAASAYADSRRKAWATVWNFFGVDPAMAESVVFPEIVRYNHLKDWMEKAVVRGSYTARGSSGFNFSLGHFQMKPSFAEELEKRWMQSGYPSEYDARFDTDDTEFARRARIERLSDDLWQCVYLAMFMKLFPLDYDISALSGEDRLRVMATAYNRGCRWTGPGCGSLDEIEALSHERHFHTAVIPTKKTGRYVYADIALSRYREISCSGSRSAR